MRPGCTVVCCLFAKVPSAQQEMATWLQNHFQKQVTKKAEHFSADGT